MDRDIQSDEMLNLREADFYAFDVVHKVEKLPEAARSEGPCFKSPL
jgi:hypothetical protein